MEQALNNTMDRDSMIEFYFRLGMSYKDILKSLALQGFIISESHLNRLLRARSLHRLSYDLDAGIDFIFSTNCKALERITVISECIQSVYNTVFVSEKKTSGSSSLSNGPHQFPSSPDQASQEETIFCSGT